MKITFEVFRDLQRDLEWRVIYVGSAESSKYDQVLEIVVMTDLKKGSVLICCNNSSSILGVLEFTLDCNPPDPLKIPSEEDIIGSTVIMISGFYRN